MSCHDDDEETRRGIWALIGLLAVAVSWLLMHLRGLP